MSGQQSQKHVVVIGGGFAGVKLALELGHDPHYRVTLISPHDQLEYHGALYRSATGRSPLEVVIPFREIFANVPNVELINDFVTELRAHAKQVKGKSGQTYGYDALVFAIGYEIEYFGIKGMREHAQSIYTIFDTIRLRNTLRDKLIAKAGRECRITMVGAGPTGIESACDIAMFARIVADKYATTPAIPKVTIVDRAQKVLPALKPEVSEVATKRLAELGIELVLNAEVDHCTARHLSLKDGRQVQSDMIIWSAGSRASSFFERYPDIFTLDTRKRVMVSEFQQANSPDIYVLGDAASTQYSGMAQTAIYDAIQLANNFKHWARGHRLTEYKPVLPHFIVPIGHEWAVAQIGDTVFTGSEGWQKRREADYFVYSNFLNEHKAKEHYEKANKIADI
jgi:NADH dehydrogenase